MISPPASRSLIATSRLNANGGPVGEHAGQYVVAVEQADRVAGRRVEVVQEERSAAGQLDRRPVEHVAGPVEVDRWVLVIEVGMENRIAQPQDRVRLEIPAAEGHHRVFVGVHKRLAGEPPAADVERAGLVGLEKISEKRIQRVV